MSRAGRSANGTAPRRALWSMTVLIVVSTVAAGGVAGSASAPPSPVAGLTFAGSAVLLAAAGTLAVRVVLALERARRAVRPPTAARSADFPVLSRVVSRGRKTGPESEGRWRGAADKS